ncbi:MAG: response regulator, partial [Deltaproteobacteria bacterium]|nr:response regulator [Deltaproteobacteria bacterium]
MPDGSLKSVATRIFLIKTMTPRRFCRKSPAATAHSTRHATPGTGPVLDVEVGMKPVTCAVGEDSGAKSPSPQPTAVGKFPGREGIFPRHVLVVDDEPLIRWSVAESLSDLGYDVEQAGDAAAALRIVTTTATPIDAVVLDLRLPDMDDLSLLGTLRQLLPAAVLVLMTAFGTADVLNAARLLGANVLHKPFEMDELRRAVQAADAEMK